MPGEFSELTEHAHKLAEHLERGQKAAHGISFSVTQLAALTVGMDALKHAVTHVVQETRMYQALSKVLTSEASQLTELKKSEAVFDGLVHTAQIGYNRARKASRKEEQAQILETYKAGREHVRAQIQAAEIWQKYDKLKLLALAALTGMAADLVLKESQLNQNLIEANASWETRGGLMRRTLATQTELGTSFELATSAARALVHYSMDTERTFADNLRIVNQMEQGLGVEVDTAARLASIVERQLKGSFSGVADVVAQLVDDTALAGNEAAKLAESLANVMGRLRPGLGAAGLPEVLKLVGRYEGALKEVGGVPGTVEELVSKLTTPEGLTGAGILGVQPEFVATSQGVQTVMDRFAAYGKSLVGQSQGWDRQFRLNILGEMFNMSAQQANQLIMAIDRANKQQVGTISLQDRWREQMHATNAGITRIVESLKGLFQQALYYVTPGISYVVNKLADLTGWLAKSKVAVAVAGAALAVGVGWAVIGLGSLVKSLYAVAVSAGIAARSAAALAVAQAAGNTGSVGGILGKIPGYTAAAPTFSGMLGSLRLIWAMLRFTALGPLAVIAAGVAIISGMVYHIYQINKATAEAQANSRKVEFDKATLLADRTKSNLYREARFGTASGVEYQLNKLYSQAIPMFQSIEDPRERSAKMKQWMDEQQVVAAEAIARGVYTRGMFQTVQQRGLPQVLKDKELLDVTKKQGLIAEKHLTWAEKRFKQAEDSSRDVEVERAKQNSTWRQWQKSGELSD